MKHLVSVVIPTRNRLGVLREALDSVYAQKGANELFELEVIVVDDASTDPAHDVVSRYPGAQYLRLPANRGVAAARNAGIAAGKGSYIAFLDDDDLWLPGKLCLQVPVLDANPEARVVYSRFVVRRQGQEFVLPDLRFPPSGLVFHRLLMGNFCGNPLGFLLRRSALEAIGNFDESLSYAEEYDTWLRLASRFPFSFVPGVVAICRQSPYGKYSTGIVDGSRPRTMRLIIEKALALLPETAAFQSTRRQARLMWGINLVRDYPAYRAELIRPLVLATLRECPILIGSPLGRGAIAQRMREFAMASPCPVAATASFCRDLTMAAGDGGLRHRFHVRRMLALVWAEQTAGLLTASGSKRKAAGLTLIRSVLLDPSQALQKLLASLLRILAKAIGSRIPRRRSRTSGEPD